MISVVLFDLGDVVAAYDPSPRITRYAERSGHASEEVDALLRSSGFSEDCDRGVYTAREMQTEICRRLGCVFSHAELLMLQALAFTVRSSVLALGAEVARRARTGLLTNNSPLLEEAFPERFPEICRTFDPIFFSHQFGDTKPSGVLFEKVAESLETPPSEILLIDDQEGHVQGARSAGWEAVRFESEAELRAELTRRGLLDAKLAGPTGAEPRSRA
jgi:FMN phosphatase YigB (HAD superfamily)